MSAERCLIPEIEIRRFQNEFRLHAKLLLPCSKEELFPFFADAQNLELITPPFLNFRIVSMSVPEIQTGAVIDYRLALHRIPITWKSLISLWELPHAFIDEQLRGPYRYWIHHHGFESRGDGTLVSDTVRYQVFGGRLMHDLLVKRDLIEIFSFRQKRLVELFPRAVS